MRHWFSIYTLRVRIRAWGFRYFRFYPLRGRKPTAFAFPETASMPLLGWGFVSQTLGNIPAGIHAGPTAPAHGIRPGAPRRFAFF
jgi:hypothetical protein